MTTRTRCCGNEFGRMDGWLDGVHRTSNYTGCNEQTAKFTICKYSEGGEQIERIIEKINLLVF